MASFGDAFTPTEVLSTIVSANTNTDVDFVNGAAQLLRLREATTS